jgi:hypothetical protein
MRMHLAGVLLAACASAHADLYRWVDPATGSVKFSSLPPADAGIEPDVVRYNAPPAPKSGKTSAPSTSVAELEGRWRALLVELASLKPQEVSNGAAVREQVKAYESTRAELDRLDPAGASRRAAEAAAMIERLKAVQR